jgi:hypothetical protein
VFQAGLLALHLGPDVFLRLGLPESLAADRLAAVAVARRGLTLLAVRVPWDRDWPDEPALPSVLAARTSSVRARHVPARVALLALLEAAVLTWDDPHAFPGRAANPVCRRDGFRCSAPDARPAPRPKSTTSSSDRAVAPANPPTELSSVPPTTPHSTSTARSRSPRRRRGG